MRIRLRAAGVLWFGSVDRAVEWYVRTRGDAVPAFDPARVRVDDRGEAARRALDARIAIALALDLLDPRDRLAFVGVACGVSIADVARAVRMRKETAARRIESARETVEARLREVGLLSPY